MKKTKLTLIVLSFLLLLLFASIQIPINKEVTMNVRIPAIENYNVGEPWNIVNHYTWLPHFFKTLYFKNPNGDFSRTFDNILKDKITLYVDSEYQVVDSINDRWYWDIDSGCGFLYRINKTNFTIYNTTSKLTLIGEPLSNFIMIYDMVVIEGDTVHWFDKALLVGSITKPITHWIKYSNGVKCNYVYIPEYRNNESTWVLKLIALDGREISIDLSDKYGELFRIRITETMFNLE